MEVIEGYTTTPDGSRLFFQKTGRGPNVVVIPNAAYMFEDFKYLAEDLTAISYDLRNRGRSDSVTDPSKLAGGVHNDVEDLEAIRRHFGINTIGVLGHSYLGFVVALYAMKYPAHVSRVVQIGASPIADKKYPPHLTGADAVAAEVGAKLTELQKQGPGGDLEGFGKKMWALLRMLYVADPADADKITWSASHLPNESFSKLMPYYSQYIAPSMQNTRLSAADFAKANMPILTIHGTRDRHAPYGGGQDWAAMLPNARLLTIENAAHLPWIESPEKVFSSIKTFLNGEWPDLASPATAGVG